MRIMYKDCKAVEINYLIYYYEIRNIDFKDSKFNNLNLKQFCVENNFVISAS
jgi:hypothetical protein